MFGFLAAALERLALLLRLVSFSGVFVTERLAALDLLTEDSCHLLLFPPPLHFRKRDSMTAFHFLFSFFFVLFVSAAVFTEHHLLFFNRSL